MSARRIGRWLRAAAGTAWRALRAWSGDSAYETYRASAGDGPVLSRQAFYLELLQRRYSRPNRCC